MHCLRRFAVAGIVALALAGCGISIGTTPTATPEPRPTATPRPTFTPRPTATPLPTAAPTTAPATPSGSTGASGGALTPVTIDRLETFKHPAGLFRIDVPAGWSQQEDSHETTLVYVWTDAAENALIILSITETQEALTQDDLTERATEFVNIFKDEKDFSMDPPEKLRSGGVQIVWGYTAQASNGVEAPLLANTFVYRDVDKVSFLTFGIPREQFDDLKPSLDAILQSYIIDPAVPISGDPSVQRFAFDFVDDDSKWVTEDSTSLKAVIEEGVYRITLIDTDLYYLTAPDVSAANDMEVSADVLIQGNSRAGVAVRYGTGTPSNTRNYYTCWIDGGNQYGCFVSVNDRWTTLREPISNSAIKPGKVNRVSLKAQGNQIIFSVNGVALQTFTDTRIDRGQAALYLENFSTEAGAEFDNVIVTLLK
ncbi:MAG: hypothetical protein NZ699_16355 [Roseiflexus sp.]|nr:hypothetical protein [Roseiflexus sp.]MCS7290695.1 hypothetical protein [Roseiflexus sp.]MDW8145420.1 hypothetical protein [Roseiflexaceae bacterium]MDW8232241.1 hypothetical protein [Roseiflexaceae bacterium]